MIGYTHLSPKTHTTPSHFYLGEGEGGVFPCIQWEHMRTQGVSFFGGGIVLEKVNIVAPTIK